MLYIIEAKDYQGDWSWRNFGSEVNRVMFDTLDEARQGIDRAVAAGYKLDNLQILFRSAGYGPTIVCRVIERGGVTL